jgi:DNA-binding CsgD family transcriptional regulator
LDARPGVRAERLLAAKFSLRSSQSAEVALLPRTGEEAVISNAQARLTERAEPMGGTRRRRSSGRVDREAEVGAGSELAAALSERFALTRMEAVVACGLADGLTYEEIADRCGISYHTVHSHVKAIHHKVGVSSNTRLLALIRKQGLG